MSSVLPNSPNNTSQVLADEARPVRARQSAIFVLKCALAIVLVMWLVRSGRLDDRAWQAVKSSSSARIWLITAFAFYCGMLGLQTARWKILVRAMPQPISLRHAIIGTLRGACLGAWTPAGLGLDGARCVLLANRFAGEKRAAAQRAGLLASLIDRVNGLSSLLIIWLFVWSPLVTLVATIVLLIVASNRKIAPQGESALGGNTLRERFLAWWREVMQLRQTEPRALLISWLLAFATHVCNIAAFVCTLLALEPNVEFSRGVLLGLSTAPSVILATAIPLTPLGLGVTDGLCEAMLSARGIHSGGEIVMLSRALWLALCLACGVAFWIRADVEE